MNIACAAKSSSTWRLEKCSITDVIAIFTTNLGLVGRASATAALRDDPHHPRVRLSSRDADRDLLSVRGLAFVFASLSKSHPPLRPPGTDAPAAENERLILEPWMTGIKRVTQDWCR